MTVHDKILKWKGQIGGGEKEESTDHSMHPPLPFLFRLDRRKTIQCSVASEKVRASYEGRKEGRNTNADFFSSKNRNELTRSRLFPLLPSQIESASPSPSSSSSLPPQ